jgi:Heterokaryon incompatibility protein (HET)
MANFQLIYPDTTWHWESPVSDGTKITLIRTTKPNIRLLKVDIKHIFNKNIQYAIISHRWTSNIVQYVAAIGECATDYCNNNCNTCYICKLINIIPKDKMNILYKYIDTIKDKYKFLWIDTFCINQTIRSQKINQIRYMGEYYRCAAEVYCLTCGIFSTYLDFMYPMQNSWSTRGWLIQEMALSDNKSVMFVGTQKQKEILEKLAEYNVWSVDPIRDLSGTVSVKPMVERCIKQFNNITKTDDISPVTIDYVIFWKAFYTANEIIWNTFVHLEQTEKEKSLTMSRGQNILDSFVSAWQMPDLRARQMYLTVAEAIGRINRSYFTEEDDRLFSIVGLIHPKYKNIIIDGMQSGLSERDIYKQLIVYQNFDKVEILAHIAYSINVSYQDNITGINWAQRLRGGGVSSGKFLMFRAHFYRDDVIISPQGILIDRYMQRIQGNWEMKINDNFIHALLQHTAGITIEWNYYSKVITCKSGKLFWYDVRDNALVFMLNRMSKLMKIQNITIDDIYNLLQHINDIMTQEYYMLELGTIGDNKFGYLVESKEKVGIFVYKTLPIITGNKKSIIE